MNSGFVGSFVGVVLENCRCCGVVDVLFVCLVVCLVVAVLKNYCSGVFGVFFVGFV